MTTHSRSPHPRPHHPSFPRSLFHKYRHEHQTLRGELAPPHLPAPDHDQAARAGVESSICLNSSRLFPAAPGTKAGRGRQEGEESGIRAVLGIGIMQVVKGTGVKFHRLRPHPPTSIEEARSSGHGPLPSTPPNKPSTISYQERKLFASQYFGGGNEERKLYDDGARSSEAHRAQPLVVLQHFGLHPGCEVRSPRSRRAPKHLLPMTPPNKLNPFPHDAEERIHGR